ncbi:MAG TPA: hypothetical protein VGG19_02465, partial [Tepidisphaeraceae bacterium]
IFAWFLRLLPIACAVIGWRVAHFLGLLLGLLVGYMLKIAIGVCVFYCCRVSQHKQGKQAMALLPDERLIAIANDPLSRDLGWAMGELQKRGIKARPSLDSVCDLLTSPLSNRRAYGLSLLFGLYPEIFAKIGKGCSSDDPPEIWRGRLEAIRLG